MKVICPNCGGEHDADKPCPICEGFARLKSKAVETGALRGERPRRDSKPAAGPPQDQGWQA